MNEQELNLTKLSYINKDFASIYPDLLDLVKSLTNRWDPSTSNESDPGVVLLKVGAFLADHLNYNIDKNILECFLPSATQEESVRKIAEFGGYVPKYYRSAVGKVSVTYNPENFIMGFNIPPFSLVVSSKDGSVTYTQLDSMEISAKNSPATANFIEGTLQRLSVDSDVITLNNLDSNNRIYFPNQYVAENGIFIYNINSTNSYVSNQWKKTDYIYTQPVGTRCYKVDFDSSKSLPYIEFPSDIANLIEDGLAIYYIYTAGSYGNVAAGELDTVVSFSQAGIQSVGNLTINQDDFVVSNSGAIINGCEPESIDEIYRSYKKVVGTFDTLVSTQDYSNAVRTAEDDYGNNIISNGFVTDRRIDYNNAANILTKTATGSAYKNVALNVGKLSFKGAAAAAPDNPQKGWVYYNTSENKTYIYDGTAWRTVTDVDSVTLNSYLDGMTPYDLVIYALQKYSESDYNSRKYWEAMAKSFHQIKGDSDPDTESIGDEEGKLIDELEENKCINHTYRDLKNGQVYCFKNYVPLNVDIIPYNKVNKYERADILNNIYKAISDNFNASKVEFGEELNYDEVKRVIESADSRINHVRLSDFDYTTKVMVKDTVTPDDAAEYMLADQYEDSTFIADLAAKNVIAGRLALFDFDDNFKYEYGQTNCKVFSDIISITTKAEIEAESGTTSYDYVLNPNEYLEILYPSYYSKETYGSYILYNLTLDPVDKIIPANTEYTLGGGETLKLFYKDQDGNQQQVDIIAGTTIRASFDLKSFTKDPSPTYVKGTESYHQLAANENISTRELLETVFNSKQYVYWIVNNTSGTLFEAGDASRILGDGEFFIYTDSNKENLTILGRGTKLEREFIGKAMTISVSNKISQEQLSELGLASKIPFKEEDFTNNNMSATEMNIITLGEGDRFKFSAESDKIDFDTQYITSNIEYTLAGETTSTILPYMPSFYLVRSRLDLNIDENNPMVLSHGQSIKVVDHYGEKIIDEECILQSNTNFSMIGNQANGSLDLDIYNEYGITINWLTYNKVGPEVSRWEPTSATIPAGYTGWGESNGKFKYFTNASGADVGTYHVCEKRTTFPEVIDSSYALSNPTELIIPFSTFWYDYLTDSEYIIDRQYISQIFLSNPNPEEESGPNYGATAWFTLENSTAPNPIGIYGQGTITTDNKVYLQNNQAIYAYPIVNSAEYNNKTMYLRIVVPAIDGGTLTIGTDVSSGPRVVWGVNGEIGVPLPDIQNRIDSLIENSGNSGVQFHWLNEPTADISMVRTNLNDPYSMFDINNVANIMTIPEIDLENSNIEIIKSMRNY